MDTVMDYVDDYTIIVGILGITYTGKFDDIKKLDQLVEEHNKTAKGADRHPCRRRFGRPLRTVCPPSPRMGFPS